jgi:hypothetical protein
MTSNILITSSMALLWKTSVAKWLSVGLASNFHWFSSHCILNKSSKTPECHKLSRKKMVTIIFFEQNFNSVGFFTRHNKDVKLFYSNTRVFYRAIDVKPQGCFFCSVSVWPQLCCTMAGKKQIDRALVTIDWMKRVWARKVGGLERIPFSVFNRNSGFVCTLLWVNLYKHVFFFCNIFYENKISPTMEDQFINNSFAGNPPIVQHPKATLERRENPERQDIGKSVSLNQDISMTFV